MSVSIEIIDDELGVVGAGSDVAPQVDAPESSAIHFVGIQDYVSGGSVVGVVVGVGGVPLDDDFVGSVVVEVGD